MWLRAAVNVSIEFRKPTAQMDTSAYVDDFLIPQSFRQCSEGKRERVDSDDINAAAAFGI
jgi:hypothetical protein